jgi:hypothetical protein
MVALATPRRSAGGTRGVRKRPAAGRRASMSRSSASTTTRHAMVMATAIFHPRHHRPSRRADRPLAHGRPAGGRGAGTSRTGAGGLSRAPRVARLRRVSRFSPRGIRRRAPASVSPPPHVFTIDYTSTLATAIVHAPSMEVSSGPTLNAGQTLNFRWTSS